MFRISLKRIKVIFCDHSKPNENYNSDSHIVKKNSFVNLMTFNPVEVNYILIVINM